MLTPTPNFGLNRWEDTDEWDVNEVNDNADKIDLLSPPTVCTAGTRPVTNLFIGRMIWQTDTEEFYRHNGTDWIRVHTSAPVVANAAARPTLGLYRGMMVWQTDVANFYMYNGTAWVPVYAPHYSAQLVNTAIATGSNMVGVTHTSVVAKGGPWSAPDASWKRAVPEAGFYRATYKAMFDANATGRREAQIKLNITGTNISGSGSTLEWVLANNDGASTSTTVRAEWEGQLAANDTLAFGAAQASGGNLDVLGGQLYYSRVTIDWLRPI